MKNDPLQTVEKLITGRYGEAKAVFWSGSVLRNQATTSSDLDIVVVFEFLPHAYREAFMYEGWPIDAFIHDLDSLRYFCCQLEASDGRPALINMILSGREILGPNKWREEAKKIARKAFNAGPDEWSKAQIDRERFLITDILDDITFPKDRDEQITAAVHLFEPLIQFYFRAQKKWAASGKSLMRLLKAENPDFAAEFNESFEVFFKTGDTSGIENVVKKIVEPYGGLFWSGFRADAPAEWKLKSESEE